jgi:branched-chain amino acid transport system permease protein
MRNLFRPSRIAWCVALVGAILTPLLVGSYLTSILALIAIWSIVAISLNLIYGYTGQLSLASSAFLGIGAYSFGLTAVKCHLGFWPSFFASIGITGIAGCLIGIPALRLRGPYFVLVTLGFASIVGVIILAWVDLTGGANGLGGMPRPHPIPLPWGGRLSFDSLLSMYYFIVFFLVLIAWITHRIVRSLVGKTFVAIAHDEGFAESVGINTMAMKLLSFTISAVFSGVAGALFASFNGVISPDLAFFARGMDSLAYLIVGGTGTMAGPILGTLVLMVIPELLQIVPYLKTLVNGIILLLFIILLPSGITGGFKTLRSSLEWGRPRRSDGGGDGAS